MVVWVWDRRGTARSDSIEIFSGGWCKRWLGQGGCADNGLDNIAPVLHPAGTMQGPRILRLLPQLHLLQLAPFDTPTPAQAQATQSHSAVHSPPDFACICAQCAELCTRQARRSILATIPALCCVGIELKRMSVSLSSKLSILLWRSRTHWASEAA